MDLEGEKRYYKVSNLLTIVGCSLLAFYLVLCFVDGFPAIRVVKLSVAILAMIDYIALAIWEKHNNSDNSKFASIMIAICVADIIISTTRLIVS